MRSRRILRAAICGAAVTTTIALALPAASAVAATRAATSSGPRATYIIFLRSPSATVATGARQALVRSSQNAISGELAAFGARVVGRTLVPDTMSASLTAAQAAALRANKSVTHVLVNAQFRAPASQNVALHYHAATKATASDLSGSLSAICGTAAHPQLNPEALTNIDAEPAILAGFNGAGVKEAYIADGLDTTDPDFQRNAQFASAGSPTGSPVVTETDFSGDGPGAPTAGGEAFLDASSMVAQGNQVYDLSNYVNPAHPLPAGCDIRVQGDSPGASLEALPVFSSFQLTTNTNFISAINYAVTSGVKVLNESFGNNGIPDSSTDAIKLADDAAVAAGVTVVVSSGDAGINSTIGSPSTDPNVLSVGATTTFRSYQQATEGGINAPGIGNGKVADNNISSLSSGGFAANGKTVDLVAPGDSNWALCSASSLYGDCGGLSLEFTGGTSESAPLTSGAAADVIQAYASTHHGAYPTPALVKHILTSTANDISAPGEQQGAGLLDVSAAVNLARSIPGTTLHVTTGGLLASTSQLDLSGNPSSSVAGTVALTNTSSLPAIIAPYARQLIQHGSTSGTVTLDPSVSTTQPDFPIWSGALETYQTATFNVPANTDRVKFDAGYQFTGQGSLLHVALFSPSGTYEGYSVPQGLGDYADVQVANPQAGTWTAVFFSVWDGWNPPETGTSGPIPYTASYWRYQSVGDVDPGIAIILPGQTQNVTLHLNTGSNPGDVGMSLVIGGGMTLPVTLRTVVPTTSSAGGTFTGVLTGGNGRAGAPAQENTWVFNVPAGKKDLDASISLASNNPGGLFPGDQFYGYLVDPSGEAVAYDTNYTFDDSFNLNVTPYVQLYKANPAPGQWELTLQVANPVMGIAISTPFSGAVRFNQVSTSSNLPNSALSTISASAGGLYTVTVHNTGVAPMMLSTDARLPTSTTLTLPDFLGAPATQAIPGDNTYYVPTETSSLSESLSATLPSSFDFSTYTGDPDVSPQTGGPGVTASGADTLNPTATYAPTTGVASGLWFTAASAVGPFSGPQPAGTETTTFTATTKAFDPAVSSSTGDNVESFTQYGEFGPIGGDVIQPGETDTIEVAINPTASVGTTVSGTLYITANTAGAFEGTLTGANPFTSELTAIPYKYTVSS
jgi:hypothetical protein